MFVATGVWRRVSKEFCHMKKVLMCLLLAAAVVTCGSTLYAQMPEGAGPGGPPRRGPMTTEQRLQHLTKALNLTEDQQTKIKPILENETQQLQALRQDTSVAQQDRWSKMKAIRDNTTSQITPILTPDQQKKYETMTERHGPPPGGMGQGMGQGQGQSEPPPAPPQQ
jgi:periplasmic protein CpxP/Spy